MRMAPEKILAAPRPAIALPTIRALEFGAIPHINDPTSKIPRPARYIHLIE
jgi:hypothetical protein